MLSPKTRVNGGAGSLRKDEMMEYYIWGKPPGAEHETLLVSERAGLRTLAAAQAAMVTLAKLECTALRIQAFDPECDPDVVSRMWR